MNLIPPQVLKRIKQKLKCKVRDDLIPNDHCEAVDDGVYLMTVAVLEKIPIGKSRSTSDKQRDQI